MAKWQRPTTIDLAPLLKRPEILRSIYLAFIDDWPAQGLAQMYAEMQRLVDGGRPAGGLQGYATKVKR